MIWKSKRSNVHRNFKAMDVQALLKFTLRFQADFESVKQFSASC
jgi:hypothetical protein